MDDVPEAANGDLIPAEEQELLTDSSTEMELGGPMEIIPEGRNGDLESGGGGNFPHGHEERGF